MNLSRFPIRHSHKMHPTSVRLVASTTATTPREFRHTADFLVKVSRFDGLFRGVGKIERQGLFRTKVAKCLNSPQFAAIVPAYMATVTPERLRDVCFTEAKFGNHTIGAAIHFHFKSENPGTIDLETVVNESAALVPRLGKAQVLPVQKPNTEPLKGDPGRLTKRMAVSAELEQKLDTLLPSLQAWSDLIDNLLSG